MNRRNIWQIHTRISQNSNNKKHRDIEESKYLAKHHLEINIERSDHRLFLAHKLRSIDIEASHNRNTWHLNIEVSQRPNAEHCRIIGMPGKFNYPHGTIACSKPIEDEAKVSKHGYIEMLKYQDISIKLPIYIPVSKYQNIEVSKHHRNIEMSTY